MGGVAKCRHDEWRVGWPCSGPGDEGKGEVQLGGTAAEHHVRAPEGYGRRGG